MRAFRKGICRLLIGVLLLSQFAIAAYACPGMAAMSATAGAAVDGAVAAMGDRHDESAVARADGAASNSDLEATSPCEGMDRAVPNLCAEHCRYGQQSADHAQVPTVAPALLAVLYELPSLPAETAGSVSPLRASGGALLAVAATPHAILHCCFRI